MKNINYAFLNLKGHFRGDLMLKTLIENDIIPAIVIEELSSLSFKNSLTLLKDLEIDKEITHNFHKHNIVHLIVSNHNDNKVAMALKQYKINLIVLGDCRIIKREIFELPKFGVINIHPGFLPIVRGNNPYIWAIVKKLPQGCTAHFIDDGIDTGPIILRKEILINNIKSYKELLITINKLCSEMIVEIMQTFLEDGGINSIKQIDLLQNNEEIYYFTAAPNDVKQNAKMFWIN